MFMDNKDREEAVNPLPPPSLPFGSVLRMRVEKAEVPFYTINFVRPAGILSSIAGLMLFLLNLEQGRGSMI